MMHNFNLKPVNPNVSTWFEGLFIHNGEEWVFTKNHRAFRKDQLPPNSEVLIIKFGPRGKLNYVIKFNDEPHNNPVSAANGELSTQEDTHRKLLVSLLETDHRVNKQYKRNGHSLNNNVSGDAEYMLENLSIQKQDSILTFDKQVKAYSIIRKMSFEEKGKLSYFFGYNPAEKSHTELTSFLADLQVGVIVNSISPGPGIKSNLDKFLEDYVGKDNYVAIQTLLRSAIDTHTVELISGQGYYYKKESLNAFNEKQLSQFLMDNPDMAKAIEADVEIASKKQAGIDDDQTKLPKVKEINSLVKASEEDTLRDQAKELKLQGWNVMGVEKLKVQLEIAERTILVAKKHKVWEPGMTLKKAQDAMANAQIDYDEELKTIVEIKKPVEDEL